MDMIPVKMCEKEVQLEVPAGEFCLQGLSQRANSRSSVEHQNLVRCLKEALIQMRAAQGADAFWQMVRVVFLSDTMLPAVDDELLNKFNHQHASDQMRRFGLMQWDGQLPADG